MIVIVTIVVFCLFLLTMHLTLVFIVKISLKICIYEHVKSWPSMEDCIHGDIHLFWEAISSMWESCKPPLYGTQRITQISADSIWRILQIFLKRNFNLLYKLKLNLKIRVLVVQWPESCLLLVRSWDLVLSLALSMESGRFFCDAENSRINPDHLNTYCPVKIR